MNYMGIGSAILALTMVIGVQTAPKADPHALCEDDHLRVYNLKDLDFDVLTHRNGDLIIEKCIGVCTSDEGDGRILDLQDENFFYISYRRVRDVHEGDTILSYFLYNPDTNYEDDVLERFDYIIDCPHMEGE